MPWPYRLSGRALGLARHGVRRGGPPPGHRATGARVYVLRARIAVESAVRGWS